MKSYVAAAVAALAVVGSTGAEAAQFTIQNDIYTGPTYASSYTGPSNGTDGRGVVSDGGYDAFDWFGYYDSNIGNFGGAVTLERRTEAFQSLNLYRFFDTFTNTTSSDITLDLQFYGDLGSDGREHVSRDQGGLVVTCQYSGECYGDPVLALVSGNNGLSNDVVSWNAYNVYTSLTLGAGESVSLLNFAFLALDTSGNRASDVALATNTGLSLLANPYLDGLSSAQRARIANWTFDAAPVSEPAVVGLLGLGLVGIFGLRRRKA